MSDYYCILCLLQIEYESINQQEQLTAYCLLNSILYKSTMKKSDSTFYYRLFLIKEYKQVGTQDIL